MKYATFASPTYANLSVVSLAAISKDNLGE